MSGLAVLFHRDGRPADTAAIWAMLGAVPYRGPDGMWVRCRDSVGLGYAKLTVTPEEEAEEQPLVSPRTGCAIVADVRLDNRDDLLARLPERLPATTSDAELILRAYEVWGTDAVARLLGDFAFALWDPRRQRLVCARDTSGQRPLYYRVDRHTFAATSEIHQLLQDPAVPVAPDEAHIREFLVPFNMLRNAKDQASTFYEGIAALRAGHLLVVDREHLHLRQYWGLEPPAEIRYRSDGEYAEHYRALLAEVVRSRLRTARPVGSTLSGGLDSSSVVCTAQELYRAGRAGGHDFTTFSLVYDGLECDERDLIQDVQAKYGFAARYIPAPLSIARLRLEASGFQESPLSANTEFEAVLKAASEVGARTLLTGEVADACVGGLPLVFDSLLRHGHLREAGQRLIRYYRASGEPLRTILALYCLAPLLPLRAHKRLMLAYTCRTMRRNESRLLPTWIPAALRDDLGKRHAELWLQQERGRRFSNPVRHYESNNLYPAEFARSSAPWSLTLAHPFADRRLHEFLLAVPPEQKYDPHPETDLHYAASKYLVRRATRGMLPDSLRTRATKQVFNSVFASELERQWPEYQAAFGPTGASRVAARGYVDREAFWARLQALRGGELTRDFVCVVRVVALETWLRTLELPRPQLVTVAPPPFLAAACRPAPRSLAG